MGNFAMQQQSSVGIEAVLHQQWQRENQNQEPVLRPQLVERGKHKPNYAGSMYLSKLTRTKSLRERISLAVQALEPWGDWYDAIAFCGMSGALIAPAVAVRLNKEMIMVRKSRKDADGLSHSLHIIEGDVAARNYIIVDDFIDTGKTRDYIKRTLAAKCPGINCLGVLQVNHLDSITLDDFERRGVPYPLAQ